MNLLCQEVLRLAPEFKEEVGQTLLVKSDVVEGIKDADRIVSAAKKEADDILKAARDSGNSIVSKAEKQSEEIKAQAFESGMEGSAEKVREMYSDFLNVGHEYLDELDDEISEMIGECVRSIISNYNDLDLIKSFLDEARAEMLDGKSAMLWVSKDVYKEFRSNESIDDSLTIFEDPGLAGPECRLDNGSVILEGNSKTQVDSMVAALKFHMVNKKISVGSP